jgi:hypothetical protein
MELKNALLTIVKGWSTVLNCIVQQAWQVFEQGDVAAAFKHLLTVLLPRLLSLHC